MAVFTAEPLSGGTSAGGVFNLTDAQLIAQFAELIESEMATDASLILSSQGATPGAVEETWGVVVT